jgi:hypothetical protein
LLNTVLGEPAVDELFIELEGGLGKFRVEMLALEFVGVGVEYGLSMPD